jgi:hypothetical protein
MKRLVLWLIPLLGAFMCAGQELYARFEDPPAGARPWVYWYFMDGNRTREGITADLEAMKAAGIGGALMLEVGIGIPRGPVKFMSPEWLELFRFAAAEADRLGIVIAVGTGPGWCGTGGPWVKPEESMQHTVASETAVEGPARFDAVLPLPAPRNPYFGVGTLSPGLKKQWQEFHQDVAVVAFPTPEGNLRLKDADEKALYFRAPFSSTPGVKPYLLPETGTAPQAQCIAPERVVDLKGRMGADGHLVWDVPAGKWTILRVCRTLTGQTTRPAPEPGLGFETDKFSASALDRHLADYADKLLAAAGEDRHPDRGLAAFHFDSWEMSSQNGSPLFLEEFTKRRGYSPLPYLAAFTGRVVGNIDITERFLWDVRQTAQELTIANHISRLRDYAHKNGLVFSSEPYDLNPCSDLESGALADEPMCEFWSKGYGCATEYSCFEAVSIAHTMGRAVVGAEAFTAAGEAWRQYPGSMKEQGDWAFCCGINRFKFHTFQHQPRMDEFPGMTMGPYGVNWNRNQTWWKMSGAYHQYLARCQEVLRQGLPVADILYVVPEGAPCVFRPPADATDGAALPDRRGYNFDGCAPGVLLARASATADGRIAFPDGMTYRALVLPQTGAMTPALLRKIAELADAGVPVFGNPASRSPSLSGYPACDREAAALAGRLAAKCRLGGDSAFSLAKWIWAPGGSPAASAPPGECRFSKAFTLAGPVASAIATLTADNSFELFVNGKSVGSGDDFHVAYSFNIKPLLRPGANAVEIVAKNWSDSPNPAGLVAALSVRLADGTPVVLVTDKSWECRKAAGTGSLPAAELGPIGMPPWHLAVSLYPSYVSTAAVLREGGLPPDFESDQSVRYIHKAFADRDIYFIANRLGDVSKAQCRFRVTGVVSAEWWDPLTGERKSLAGFAQEGGVTSLSLRLEPHESGFVVFNKAARPDKPSAARETGFVKLCDVAGPWRVAFDSKWGGPSEPVPFATLQDWSTRPEPGVRFYSGTAEYQTVFDCPQDVAGAAGKQYLALGDVKCVASVSLNGTELGVLWCPPWRVRVPARLLREKGNTLTVRVANLWPNRLIGDTALAADKRLTKTTFNPYNAKSPLLPSGLLGPVALFAAE